MKKYGPMKALTLVGIILLALTWAGCTAPDAPSSTPSGNESTQASSGQTKPQKPQKPAKEKTQEKTTQKQQDFKVGDTAYFQDSKVTVISYMPNMQPTNEFLQPKAGTQYAAIDVEGCANQDAANQVTLNPFDFQLVMPDNTRLQPSFGGPEPALNHGNLLAGDCLRGYVTFEVPQGQSPKAVLYAKMISNKQPTKWTI